MKTATPNLTNNHIADNDTMRSADDNADLKKTNQRIDRNE